MDVVVVEDVDDVENVQHLWGYIPILIGSHFDCMISLTRCECEAISHRHRL